jgi:hypothetical protein
MNQCLYEELQNKINSNETFEQQNACLLHDAQQEDEDLTNMCLRN